MISEENLAKLVGDFKEWGMRRTRRILRLTKEHGVLCSAEAFSNGKKG